MWVILARFRPREGKGWSRTTYKSMLHFWRHGTLVVSVPVRGKGGLERWSDFEDHQESAFFVSVPVRGKGGLERFPDFHPTDITPTCFRPREGKGWSRRNNPLKMAKVAKVKVSVPVRGKGGLEVHKRALSSAVLRFRPREGKGWSRRRAGVFRSSLI